MAKKTTNDVEKQAQEQRAETCRRKSCLMAAALGVTQTALTQGLLEAYWDQNYANTALAELLNK